ncbi:MAG: FliM/FliN family flagellar motor switch protein [Deltaproteobacteria bacterium]|nr:FliM/FliN family flagellar motor switch protein [Deltaproteobacteria bacterium]
MKTKDPYLSELDALGEMPSDEATGLDQDFPPIAPEETAPAAPAPAAPAFGEESMLLASDVPVQLVALIGRKPVTMKELMELKTGAVVELDRGPGEMIDLVASGRVIANGELVEIDGKLGVRILKIIK